MKTTNIIITIIGVLLLTGIIYLIVQSTKKTKIQNAAISSGVPPAIANSIANSSDPAKAARMVGIPSTVADSIANGVAVVA